MWNTLKTMFLNVKLQRLCKYHHLQQGRAETFGGAGAQSIKGAHGTQLFNRAVLLADMCIEMDASVLIQQQMP